MSRVLESRARLRSALRLVMVSAGVGDVDGLLVAARTAVEAGVRAVHVREPRLGARELAAVCLRLRALLDPIGGLVVVGDRVDVASSGAAHAVQLGHRSLEPAAVRAFAGEDLLIGCSTHDAAEIAGAVEGGADFVTLAPVFPTASKPGHPGLGLAGARALTASCPLPVVWLGGFDAARIAACVDEPAVGFAALGAFTDPHGAQALVAALGVPEVGR